MKNKSDLVRRSKLHLLALSLQPPSRSFSWRRRPVRAIDEQQLSSAVWPGAVNNVGAEGPAELDGCLDIYNVRYDIAKPMYRNDIEAPDTCAAFLYLF